MYQARRQRKTPLDTLSRYRGVLLDDLIDKKGHPGRRASGEETAPSRMHPFFGIAVARGYRARQTSDRLRAPGAPDPIYFLSDRFRMTTCVGVFRVGMEKMEGRDGSGSAVYRVHHGTR